MLTCPATSPPDAAIGASENGATCCPTHLVGSASSRSRQWSLSAADIMDGNTDLPRPVGRTTIWSRWLSTCERSVSSPHQNVGTDAIFRVSPSTARASRGRNGASPGLSNTPLPRVFTTVTVPRRQASASPTTPSRDAGLRSNGSDQ